ncbi:MAG: hypothetical protein EA383_07665 [Spirochaetaceae bacterium]|nr:MAG: hypothetical protein EA383_07665 [Spirochaetaceae bacterium]
MARSTDIPRRLKLQAGGVVFLQSLLGVPWAIHVFRAEGVGSTFFWLVGFISAVAVSSAVFLSSLRENRAPHPPDAPIRSDLGLANTLTMLRSYAVSVLFAIALFPVRSPILLWAPFVLYTVSITIDFFDGFIARVTRRPSLLGETLEHEFDSIGLISATLVVAARGTLSWWFMLPALYRYIFMFAYWRRVTQGLPVVEPDNGGAGRVIAGLYWGYIATALIPIFPVHLLRLGAAFFVVPLTGAFLRDWFIVTGRLVPGTGMHRLLSYIFRVYVFGWIPLAVRIASAGLIILLAQRLSGIPSAILILAASGLMLGAMARTNAILSIAILSLPVVYQGVSGAGLVQIVVALNCLIIVAGGGRFALARHEDIPFASRLGGGAKASH